jgi:hypothetical protein
MTVNDPIAVAARASAERLAAEYGADLAADVEVALHARRTAQRPDQYIDPVSVGSLIVAIATLAWTVYTDLRKKAPEQPQETLAREISIKVGEHNAHGQDSADKITSVVITEIIHASEGVR